MINDVEQFLLLFVSKILINFQNVQSKSFRFLLILCINKYLSNNEQIIIILMIMFCDNTKN